MPDSSSASLTVSSARTNITLFLRRLLDAFAGENTSGQEEKSEVTKPCPALYWVRSNRLDAACSVEYDLSTLSGSVLSFDGQLRESHTKSHNLVWLVPANSPMGERSPTWLLHES